MDATGWTHLRSEGHYDFHDHYPPVLQDKRNCNVCRLSPIREKHPMVGHPSPTYLRTSRAMSASRLAVRAKGLAPVRNILWACGWNLLMMRRSLSISVNGDILNFWFSYNVQNLHRCHVHPAVTCNNCDVASYGGRHTGPSKCNFGFILLYFYVLTGQRYSRMR